VSAENSGTKLTFSWSAANFNVAAEITYTLYARIGDDGEEKAVTGSTTTELSCEVSYGALNNAALAAGATPEVAAAVQFFVKAAIASPSAERNSNAATINITTFTDYPPAIHIIGDVLGGEVWNNNNYTYVMFRDNNDSPENVYTTNFKVGEGFKFISNADLGTWSNLYGKTGAGVLGYNTGGNIPDITVAGYYTVTADVDDLTYSITEYDASNALTYTHISLIGDFNSWGGDMDLAQTNYDPHIWVADDVELSAGGLKFRADHDWATSWGADSFPFGKSDGNNITVYAGTYFVKFNDLTGHYVFYAK
jgi:hypothetical protein